MSYWIAGAAAVGAMMDRKNPIRGAAMGAGLVATGGAAAGALGAGGAAAGAGTAAGTVGAAGGTGAAGGLLATTGTGTALTGAGAGASAAGGTGLAGGLAASQGAGLGLAANGTAGMTAATGGTGTAGGLLATQGAGTALTPASTSGGLASFVESAKTISEGAKPFMQAAQSAQQIKGLMSQPGEAPPPSQPIQTQPLDLSSVLNQNQQEMARTFEEDMKRRQTLNDFAKYAMGAR